MLSGKSRAEQVEEIKQLIRQFNYRENQKVYEQCLSMGLSVNIHSLSRFSEKLELLDRAERAKQARDRQGSVYTKMTYAQVKQREMEITFELGELKIREHKLLEELNTLSTKLDVKQFN
jgi:hypothetical protein